MTSLVDARAWGWVHHLREGGATPWADWSNPGDPGSAVVPSAQQLELLRRLNLAGRPSADLVDRVLRASPPGRGQPDLELAGAVRESRFGPRPVDPADVPAGELLRVAAVLVAEALVAAGVPDPDRRGFPRPWRQHYRLAGDPELTGPLRDHLVSRGRPPGGQDAVVLVLARPLDRMLADVWTHRSFDVGPAPWAGFVQRLVRDDEVPRGADPLREARAWRERVGRDRVEVVVGTPPADRLGLRRPVAAPAEAPAVVPDLARRVAALLGLYVPSRDRAELLQRRLRPLLAGVEGPTLALPQRHHAWAARHAARIAEGLRSDGYAVHGDLAALQPSGRAGVVAPDPEVTLDLALRLLLDGVGGQA